MSAAMKVVTREAPEQSVPLWRRVLAGGIQAILIVAVLAAVFLARSWLFATAPEASREPRPRLARLVETVQVAPAPTGPVIEAWGEVVPARQLVLRPEISGRVTTIHPDLTEGGRLSAGAAAFVLDDRDMALAAMQVDAEVAQIEARILIERGQAAIGERELTRLSRNLTDEQRALVLREPQMRQLEAELSAARARLDQARLNLDRIRVTVPFDALVIDENLAIGAMLSEGAEAANLVAADRFHVKLALPPADLVWVEQTLESPVRLTHDGVWPEGTAREGWIRRLSSELTETGRLAEVIVVVDDPLLLGDVAEVPPLLLGSFVKAEMTVPAVPGTVLVDRGHLRDNDTVWVMRPDNTLEVRPVSVVWRGSETVLVSDGLASDETIVTTQLASFADGMALRVREDAAEGGDGRRTDGATQ